MKRTLALVALWLVGVAFVGVAVTDVKSTSPHYGVAATHLNESELPREESITAFADVPRKHREGVRNAIEEGHGSLAAGTASDAEYYVRYEGDVYRIDAQTVADPEPMQPRDWVPHTFAIVVAGTAIGYVVSRRLGGDGAE